MTMKSIFALLVLFTCLMTSHVYAGDVKFIEWNVLYNKSDKAKKVTIQFRNADGYAYSNFVVPPHSRKKIKPKLPAPKGGSYGIGATQEIIDERDA